MQMNQIEFSSIGIFVVSVVLLLCFPFDFLVRGNSVDLIVKAFPCIVISDTKVTDKCQASKGCLKIQVESSNFNVL